MAEDVFLPALRKVTSGAMSLGDLIGAANDLTARGEIGQAQQLYTIWSEFNRDHAQAYVARFNGATLYSQTGDTAAAEAALRAAIEQNPDFLPAYVNLGGVLERSGRADEALATWQAALGRQLPVTGASVGYIQAVLRQLGRLLGENHRLENAEAALFQSLLLNINQPDVLEQFLSLRLGQGKWPVVAPWEGTDRKTILGGMHPLSMCAYTDDPLLQLATASRYIHHLAYDKPIVRASDRSQAPIDLTGRRLRVGYISSDLRDHAVGYLMAELFELHDREKLEVFAYYCGIESTDALNARTQAAVENWRDIRKMGDDEAAALIAADEIDILVDVNGHTRDARTGVFARRPAPIQVNWLGYPGTMGGPDHHYIIADPWIIPEESEIYYSEKVVRLPCYQPNDRKRKVAETPTRAAAGLPEDAFVFCCFNATHKITRFTFDRWLEILQRTPSSVLWLLEGTEDTRKRLVAYAVQRGVDAARLIFAPKMANPFHLARYPLADLFLDTGPYGAHTTASDALWMGVPMITLSGRSFASRVCGSLVRAAGLADLVFTDARDYVERAVALAAAPEEIKALKARLEAGRATSDLFNMDLLVERLAELYHGMVADYQAGELPKPDLRNLEVYREIGLSLDHEGQELMTTPGYEDLYRTRLAERNEIWPVQPDARLWPA